MQNLVEINEKKWRLFIIFSWNAYYSLVIEIKKIIKKNDKMSGWAKILEIELD